MKFKSSIAVAVCLMVMTAGVSCGTDESSSPKDSTSDISQSESQENKAFVSKSQSSVEIIEETDETLKMPDFYGMDYNTAVSQYGNHIQFEMEGSEYSDLDEGLICGQNISGGTEFRGGDVLKVKISKGMDTIEIPNVTNMHAELARDQLTLGGLECEIKES